MKNTILSRLSSYSYNSDCNGVVADIIPPQMSSSLINIGHDNSLCTFGGDDLLNNEFGVQNMDLAPCKDESTLLDFSLQGSMIFHQPWDNNIWVQQTNHDSNTSELHLVGNARKRPSDHSTVNCRIDYSSASETKKQRQKKVATVKRSQKFTDKITALQKLVSPYGKTDTASVLLEASISIKALQHQIQELFHMRSSGQSPGDMRGEKRSDLRSRGICLVPVAAVIDLKQLEKP